jgi:hypothetical protein
VTALAGWMALGTGIVSDVFVECKTYDRRPFVSARDGTDPTHQTLLPIRGVTSTAGEPDDCIVVGAVFDSETGGHCLGWWSWAPTRIVLPGTFPQLDAIVSFSHPVTLAINFSRSGRTADLDIPRGAPIGSVNWNTITAGCGLLVTGGRLIARASAAKRPAAAAA